MSRILVVSGYWPTAANSISGIFVVQQTAALCRAGCTVKVIVGKEVWKRGERYLSPQELGLSPGSVELIETSIVRMPEALSANRLALAFNIRCIGRSLSKAVARLSSKGAPSQGIIIHGLRYAAISAQYWAAKSRARKIAFIHGFDPFLSRPGIEGVIRAHLHQANNHIDVVALVGSPLRQHADWLNIDASKIVVIPNGSEIPDRSEIRQERKEPNEDLVIVSVSHLVDWKGVDENIRALRLLQERFGISSWQYRIVGDGPEREHLDALVEVSGLRRQVHFLGRLPYEDTMREVAAADIFSLPSWGEAFGIVYLEAMARMRPAIGCLGRGAADVMTNGLDGILVPPRDPEALALAFRDLFDKPGLREQIGQRARATAEKYTWDRNARCVLEALNL